jgi:hypothetical protein
MRLPSPRRRIELQIRLVQILVHFDDRGLVSAPVAVVRRRENGDEVVLVGGLVALLN